MQLSREVCSPLSTCSSGFGEVTVNLCLGQRLNQIRSSRPHVGRCPKRISDHFALVPPFFLPAPIRVLICCVQASSPVGIVPQQPPAKKSRLREENTLTSAGNAPKSQRAETATKARSLRARRSQPGNLSEVSLFDAAFSSAHTEDHAIPTAVDDGSPDSAEAYADPDGDAPSDASTLESPESDNESSWSGILDGPALDNEPASGTCVVKVPDEDKVRIREYLLKYRTEFTNWRTVLLDLAALSLAESRVDNLEAFMDTLVTRPPSLTPNPVGSFRNRPGDDWINDDDEITEEWDTSLCPDIEALAGPELDIRTLSKPSGRRDATLSLVLHYPTFNTGRLRGGSTFDPSNPCLNMIKTKIGPSQAVKVQDRIMARHECEKQVDWSRAFPNWAEMAERFLSFNRFLNEDSPILILMGNENCRRDNLGDLVRLGQDDEICWIRFAVAAKLFGDGASFALVRNKTTRAIKRVVFLSWHPNRFFHSGPKVYGAYHDLIFNACCELAGIDSVNEGYFTWKLKKWEPPLNMLNRLRTYEKQTHLLDEGLVRTLLSNLIKDNPELFGSHVLSRSASGSYIGGVIATLGGQGLATQAAAGYPNLAKGLATNTARGFANLAKGRATMAAAGNPQLVKAFATNVARGHPGLVKGLATNAAKGYPNLKKGMATRQEKYLRHARAHLKAVFKLKQVQDLLTADPADLAYRPKQTRDTLMKFAEADMSDIKSRVTFKNWLYAKVVLWTPDTPEGLRWDGDGCPDEDTFDYSKPHPGYREGWSFCGHCLSCFLCWGGFLAGVVVWLAWFAWFAWSGVDALEMIPVGLLFLSLIPVLPL
ncbi:hypothetical protein BR93DRAFT_237858 [Coniochaeta sp. PMI_546]|nr:hypothetical protein BR93DRAFT_237858 [Coniochaeta sp. PMI_546]